MIRLDQLGGASHRPIQMNKSHDLGDSVITLIEQSISNGIGWGKFHWKLKWKNLTFKADNIQDHRFMYFYKDKIDLLPAIFPQWTVAPKTPKKAFFKIGINDIENIQYLSIFFELKRIHICKIDMCILKSNGEGHFLGSFGGSGMHYKEDQMGTSVPDRSWKIMKGLEVGTIIKYSTVFTPGGILTLEGTITCELKHPLSDIRSINNGFDESIPDADIEIRNWEFCNGFRNSITKSDSKGDIKRLREWFTEESGDPVMAWRLTSWFRWDLDTPKGTYNALHPIISSPYSNSAYSPPITVHYKKEWYSIVLRAKKVCIEGKDFLNFTAKSLIDIPDDISVLLYFHEKLGQKKLIISDHVILRASDALEGICLINLPLPFTNRAIKCISTEGPVWISCKIVIHRQRFGENVMPNISTKRLHGRLDEWIRDSESTIIGLEFLIEIVIQIPKSKLWREYNCSVCQYLGKVQGMFDHLKDISHKFNVLKRRYPDIINRIDVEIDEEFIDKEIDRLNIRDNDNAHKITKINRDQSYLYGNINLYNKPLTVVEYQNNENPENHETELQEICKYPDPLKMIVVPELTNATTFGSLPGINNVEMQPYDIPDLQIIYALVNQINCTFKDWNPLKLDDELNSEDDLKTVCTLVQEISKKVREYHKCYSIDDVLKTEILHAQVDAIMEGQCVIDTTLENTVIAKSNNIMPNKLENVYDEHIDYSVDDVIKTEIFHAQVDAIIEGQCAIDHTLENNIVTQSNSIAPNVIENAYDEQSSTCSSPSSIENNALQRIFKDYSGL